MVLTFVFCPQDKGTLRQRGEVRGDGVKQRQDGGEENNRREADRNGKTQDCDKRLRRSSKRGATGRVWAAVGRKSEGVGPVQGAER